MYIEGLEVVEYFLVVTSTELEKPILFIEVSNYTVISILNILI